MSGPVKIKQLKYEADFGPIDPEVETVPHSRAYLHHLFKQHEPLFMTLASQVIRAHYAPRPHRRRCTHVPS